MGREEREVSDQIRDFLEAKGFKVYRMQSGRFRGNGGWVTMNPLGTPDLIACCKVGDCGIFVALEVKTEIGTVSSAQNKEGDEIKNAGGYFCIVRNTEEVRHFIKYVKSDFMRKMRSVFQSQT